MKLRLAPRTWEPAPFPLNHSLIPLTNTLERTHGKHTLSRAETSENQLSSLLKNALNTVVLFRYNRKDRETEEREEGLLLITPRLPKVIPSSELIQWPVKEGKYN